MTPSGVPVDLLLLMANPWVILAAMVAVYCVRRVRE